MSCQASDLVKKRKAEFIVDVKLYNFSDKNCMDSCNHNYYYKSS